MNYEIFDPIKERILSGFCFFFFFTVTPLIINDILDNSIETYSLAYMKHVYKYHKYK